MHDTPISNNNNNIYYDYYNHHHNHKSDDVQKYSIANFGENEALFKTCECMWGSSVFHKAQYRVQMVLFFFLVFDMLPEEGRKRQR